MNTTGAINETRRYHHGDLRQAVLSAAIAVIAESGPESLSLRDLARRAGVSHAAPAHHFGDKAGLLTAIAGEGYRLLADALDDTWRRTGQFLEVGVTYVRFAIEHRSHFEVMFRPDLYDASDPSVVKAEARSAAALYGGVASLPAEQRGPDDALAGVAAWSLMHGFATLWLNGALPAELGDDPDASARAIAQLLFRRS